MTLYLSTWFILFIVPLPLAGEGFKKRGEVMETISIGKVTKKSSSINIETIRYYERRGLK